MAADHFCLRWNNYQVNITSALENLKNDEDLVDVTLTCEGQNVKAHKVILSACSPYFHMIFKENPCVHPVVILKDVKYEDVTALLNFMYHGEVYITQDRLASFLHTAELLQIRGLTGAANPFKDLPLQQQHQQHQQHPLLQQQQSKVKKTFVPVNSAQLRRSTPPHSVSPSVPLTPPLKTYRAPRSPVISPNSREPGYSALLSSVKDKPREHTTHREEAEYCAKPSSPVGTPLHDSQPLTGFCVSGGLPSTSYSPLYSDKPAFPIANAAVLQPGSSESNGQRLSVENVSAVQNVVPPSSPPLPAKRRKAFPRRVSNSQLSADNPSPQNVMDNLRDVKELHESTETAICKDISVKIEQCDVELGNEQTETEDLSDFTQENLEDVDVEIGECSKLKTVSQDDQLLEEQDTAGEETGESGLLSPNQSMLLQTLSGQSPGSLQTDGSPAARSGTSGKMAALPHVPQCGTCPHCGQTYSNQSALKYHVRLMHTDMTSRHCCHLCPRSFALRDVFKAHMWSKHKQRC